jgi:hypothetical protein
MATVMSKSSRTYTIELGMLEANKLAELLLATVNFEEEEWADEIYQGVNEDGNDACYVNVIEPQIKSDDPFFKFEVKGNV